MRFYFDFLSHNEEIRDCEGVELADWLTCPSPRRPNRQTDRPLPSEGLRVAGIANTGEG
jgi:hypothetical protein